MIAPASAAIARAAEDAQRALAAVREREKVVERRERKVKAGSRTLEKRISDFEEERYVRACMRDCGSKMHSTANVLWWPSFVLCISPPEAARCSFRSQANRLKLSPIISGSGYFCSPLWSQCIAFTQWRHLTGLQLQPST